MKLPDFYLHAAFNELRKKMRADLIELVQEDSEWKRLSIQLEQEGIDVDFGEVKIQGDSTFEYKGQKVIVYIRDQYDFVLEKREYKFHLAQCDTLDSMQRKQRGKRYVVTNRKDGKFVVNIISKKASGKSAESKEMQMKVCKNCISTLGLAVTPESFSIEEFFRKYTSQIKRVPTHTEKTAPLNVYPANWQEKAYQLKKKKNWQCEECRKSFSEQRELLHVHHLDSDKANNLISNLQVLCVVCHGEKPGHEHMKATPDYKNEKRTR